MARGPTATIPVAPRKTLMEWIELDDGDTTSFTPPACSPQAKALHARITCNPDGGKGDAAVRLPPPAGLRLPPLG
ncbi:hypothetical protein [Sphingobium sp. AS12]|uniref:hypothetical protein n=1 Tax=Sphingobium sp. AS12 TaxID=2849495 RepID=UPI0020C926FB|nr:hypothetical protein [Sphingobium sp. AS12]